MEKIIKCWDRVRLLGIDQEWGVEKEKKQEIYFSVMLPTHHPHLVKTI